MSQQDSTERATPPPPSLAPEQPSAAWVKKWYSTGAPEIQDDARKVLETYSKIPPGEVDDHVSRIRDKAWAIYPYPCIGQWRFIELAIGHHSHYPEVLSRMRSGDQVYLDLGCAFAQDIRRLVSDGVDSKQCYGSDLRLDFIDLGYDLFRDRESLQSKFIDADIFEPKGALDDLQGKVDIMGASSFFHLFSWDEQKVIARQVVKMMKPQSGSLLVGRQVGSKTPSEEPRRSGGGSRYRHDMGSWRRFWKEVGDEAGIELQVDGTESPMSEAFKVMLSVGDIVLEFAVRRV